MVTNLALMVSVSLGTPQIQYAGMNLGSLVRDQLFNKVVKLDRAADRQWIACRTAKELSERQQEVHRQATAAIGGFPKKTPLNALSAVGAAAIPAAHAFFLERRWFKSFETKSPPPSWHKVVEHPEMQSYFADSVHGALRVYDWVELTEP